MDRKKTDSQPAEDSHCDDGALFRAAVRDAMPLPGNVVEAYKRKPPPRARFRRADERAALQESLLPAIDDIETDAGERLQFRRPEVGQRTLRRLARGRYSIQDEIDLHGLTARLAEAELTAFIDSCVRRGLTCVRIVHGKGRGSGLAGPVLKPLVQRWLRRWRDVLAYASARQVDGGSGATCVLLRRS